MLKGLLDGLKDWYEEADYRVLFSISLIMLLLFAGFLYMNKQRTGQWFQKGLNLRGGNQLTVSLPPQEEINIQELENYLNSQGIESTIRSTASATSREILIRLPLDVNQSQALGALQDREVDTSSHSFNRVEPGLAQSFWNQSQLALMAAFIFMAVAVFIVYRNFVPSIAIILAAFTDIVCTLSIMQIFNIPLTLASFAGLLLVLGYSIDSDIVLTTRVLKRRQGSLTKRTFSAMKTSVTMTVTTLSALVVLYFATTAQALRNVAIVLIIALLVDLVATWFGNASILRWWSER